MATSGQPMQAISRRSEARTRPGRGRWLARAAMCCLAAVAIGGCATSIAIGKPPATDRLAELKWNVSTEKDIVAALGEPQGHGATRTPTYGLKDAWLYWYFESEGVHARSRMLMVFLDKDKHVYQGHMWVSSGMMMSQTQ